jgi:hypothetical protein
MFYHEMFAFGWNTYIEGWNRNTYAPGDKFGEWYERGYKSAKYFKETEKLIGMYEWQNGDRTGIAPLS